MDANLLQVLSKRGKGGSLENIVIYGNIRCAIERPYFMEGLNESSGYYAIIDTFAFKCLDEDYFSEISTSSMNVYFTRGSIVIYIPDLSWVGKNVRVYGASSCRGAKIKQQFVRKDGDDAIIAVQFSYRDGVYQVIPNYLSELMSSDRDIKSTALEDFMVLYVSKSSEDKLKAYPKTLDSIMDYVSIHNYVEIKVENRPEASATPKQESLRVENTVESTPIQEFDEGTNERLDLSKIDMHLTYHLEGAEKSDMYDVFTEEVDETSSKRRGYVRKLLSDIEGYRKKEESKDFNPSKYGLSKEDEIYSIDEIYSDIRERFISNIASQYSNSLGVSGKKGSYYVLEILELCKKSDIFLVSTDVSKELISNIISKVASEVQLDPKALSYDYNTSYKSIPVLASDSLFSLCVISLLTGIGYESLESSLYVCQNKFCLSTTMWQYVLIRFPYALGLLSGLSLINCDLIYYSFTREYGGDLYKYINMSLRMDLIFLENLGSADSKNTLISDDILRNSNKYYPALGTRYIKNYGFMCNIQYIDGLKALFGTDDFLIRSTKGIYEIINSKWYTKERKENLMSIGVIDAIDNELILTSDLEKEYLIYNTLIEKGHTPSGISQDVIDETIDRFESERGFKLEPLQRDGVKLTKYRAGVLSGCAGSGKTTTSDCMTEVLKTLDDYKIVYCAPTGKACRRLAEVVKGTVRTIHSEFMVFGGGDSYLLPVKSRTNFGDKKIYILDEMAMCSSSLLFEVCRNISPDDMIYFLGDIKQLPPIGKGNPFALLMKILPCVELGVSKRAAEGSLVNYNVTLINHMSDGYMRDLLYDDKTFICRECDDANIPLMVTSCWKQFMDGSINGTKYSEDDIQVISPYQKDTYSFSSVRLNPQIQSLLRRNDKLLFSNGERQFYAKERVIHTKRNDYSMNRYIFENNTFIGVATFGVVNGEMGKLVGVIKTSMANIHPFEYKMARSGEGVYSNLDDEQLQQLLDKREEKEDSLRKDENFEGDGLYFVIVSVYDVELERNVYILYRASSARRSSIDSEGLSLEGSDLGNIDYAYALTTHKMQGSQSPVVILPFGSKCNPMFVNRNMLNTMITRSQGIVCCVGTVKGADSPINKGRRYVSAVKCNDALTVLVDG